jgi:hypothetical protein
MHNHPFDTTTLSPRKTKKAPPKMSNFTYTELDQNDRYAQNFSFYK